MNILSAYLICISVMSMISIIAFAKDKIVSKDERNKRIPEIVLLSLIAMGGAPGGLIGMYVFRHKTVFREKFHFSLGVWTSLILQVALGIFISLVQFDIISFIK